MLRLDRTIGARPGKQTDTNRSSTLTVSARWQPFQDLGEDDPRRPRDEMDLMRSTLARALGRDGGRQIVVTGTSAAWAPTLDISERGDADLIAAEPPGSRPPHRPPPLRL